VEPGKRRIKVGVAGFGNVGRAFVELLVERRELLDSRYGIDVSVSFVADSKGVLARREGLPWSLLALSLKVPRGGVSGLEGGSPGMSVEEAIAATDIDVLVDVTPSNYSRPDPQLKWYRLVLGSGGAVVTADKAPLATRCDSLLTASWRPRLFYKATVMAGTPLIDMLRWGFSGRIVERVTGILNGTTNYVLGLAEEGLGFEEAIRDAQRRGYAEPDPSSDLEGLDLAAKAAIISCTLGSPTTLWSVERRSVVNEEAFERAREAFSRGRRVKYVAVVEVGKGSFVDLVEVSKNSVLFNVSGAMNAVVIRSSEAEEVTVMGPGAGRKATAAALLSDLVLAAREVS